MVHLAVRKRALWGLESWEEPLSYFPPRQIFKVENNRKTPRLSAPAWGSFLVLQHMYYSLTGPGEALTRRSKSWIRCR